MREGAEGKGKGMTEVPQLQLASNVKAPSTKIAHGDAYLCLLSSPASLLLCNSYTHLSLSFSFRPIHLCSHLPPSSSLPLSQVCVIQSRFLFFFFTISFFNNDTSLRGKFLMSQDGNRPVSDQFTHLESSWSGTITVLSNRKKLRGAQNLRSRSCKSNARSRLRTNSRLFGND